MKIRIILTGRGGELGRETIDVGNDDPAEVSEQIHEAMEAWTLAPGDIVTVFEVEP